MVKEIYVHVKNLVIDRESQNPFQICFEGTLGNVIWTFLQ